MKTKILILALLIIQSSNGFAKTIENKLSKEEKKQGWILLFDGKTLNGWRTYNDTGMTNAGWTVEDGTLKAQWGQHNKNILSREEYSDFEFSIEWKLSKQGNSGIMYHQGDKVTQAAPCTGQEYQLIDDLDYPQPLKPLQLTGVDYGVHDITGKKILKPIGEFNCTRIVFSKGHVEHWLNGEKLLEYEVWTSEWEKMVKESIWKDNPCYGSNRSGAFMLQNYPGSTVWFRNIKVRKL